MSERQQDALNGLQKYITACNVCFDACLNEPYVDHRADCIHLDRDCVDICSLLSQTIARNSPNIEALAAAYVEICRACAEECGKHEHDHCQQCTVACEACAKACGALI